METFALAKDVPLTTRVLELLQNGHENAMPLNDLCKRLVSPERKVRQAIEELRREGWQIVIPTKPPYGYFLAETKEELADYIAYMTSRMKEEYRTFLYVKNATKRKLQKEFGQLPLIY